MATISAPGIGKPITGLAEHLAGTYAFGEVLMLRAGVPLRAFQ